MNKQQVVKILRVMLIAVLLMFAFDALFEIEAVTDWISGLVTGTNGWITYIVVWLLMFLQVTIIPVPALVILNASLNVGISMSLGSWSGWIYVLVVLSAYMLGAVIAYSMGRKWGKKAIKWCAGDETEYDKWSEFMTKKGKWPYFATVLLPVFPDDLLCLVAGSIKFDFKFFFLANLVGRAAGLICMILTLTIFKSAVSGSAIPWTVVAWGLCLVALFITERILTHKINKNKHYEGDK